MRFWPIADLGTLPADRQLMTHADVCRACFSDPANRPLANAGHSTRLQLSHRVKMNGAALLTTIAATWVGAFVVLLLPGRWLGSWIAANSPNTFFGVLYCVVFSKLLIVILAVVAVFVRLPFLPHVNTDQGFALTFAATLFFVPALVAQFVGFRRAKVRGNFTRIAAN